MRGRGARRTTVVAEVVEVVPVALVEELQGVTVLVLDDDMYEP